MARSTATLPESPPQPGTAPPRRGPIGWIVAGSLVLGAVAALVLVWFAVAGAREHVITGTALLGLALGWAALALMSARWTSQPQRWALVPAAVLAVIGGALLLFAPGASVMTVLGWVWPLVLLVLAVWMLRQARRHLISWTRPWLIYPVCVLTALVAVAGAVETVRGATASTPSAAGQTYDVGGVFTVAFARLLDADHERGVMRSASRRRCVPARIAGPRGPRQRAGCRRPQPTGCRAAGRRARPGRRLRARRRVGP